MDISKRLLRRPAATASWLALLLLAALLVQLGFGLIYAAHVLAQKVEALYTTIAVPADYRRRDGRSIVDSLFTDEQMSRLAQADGVLQVDLRGFTTGWSEQLLPLSAMEDPYSYSVEIEGAYCDTILVGTVEETPKMEVRSTYFLSYEFPLRVDEVISAHPQLPIPDLVRVYWHISVNHPDADKIPEVGSQYILRGDFWAITKQRSDTYFPPEYTPPNADSPDWFQINDYYPYTQETLEEVIASGRWVPTATISKLEGSVEDFLAAPENQLWRDTLEVTEMAHHSVPILGTNCLESVYQFHQSEAVITQGRSFTQAEYETGAKVCVLSEGLAENSGLHLGDSFTISQFGYSPLLSRNLTALQTNPQGRANNPLPVWYADSLGFLSEDETYTIVGLYRQEEQWDDGSYAFTPNTVFIPAAAQPLGASFCPAGVYLSAVIENGGEAAFLASLQGTDLEERFVTFSQGYAQAAAAVSALRLSAWKLFGGAALVWVLVAVLFLTLYQAREKRNIGIMRSLGAPRAACRRALFGSAAALAALAAVLGAVAGWALSGAVSKQVLSGALASDASSAYGTASDAGMDMLTSSLPAAAPNFAVCLLVAAASTALLCLALCLQANQISRIPPRRLLGSGE